MEKRQPSNETEEVCSGHISEILKRKELGITEEQKRGLGD